MGGVSPRSLPHLALSEHAHNRMGLQRTDAEWVEAAWQAPGTRILLVAGNRLHVVDGAVTWSTPNEVAGLAEAGRRVLLGGEEGAVRFALLVGPGDAPGAEEDWQPLRQVLLTVAVAQPEQAPLLFQAVGLAEWHWATRHCPRCGGGLTSAAAGHELVCSGCGRRQFPRTDPAVIMAITSGEPGSPDEALLLGRNANWPEGRYSTLAGFCEPGERLEDAVRREVAEEVGVEVGEVTYFGSQPWPLPASLMLGFTGRATTREINVDGAEIAHARWFTREELAREVRTGAIGVPQGISISSSLIETWFGDELPHPRLPG